eukprot:scaffold22742_cov139-Cylindrotheca_fusiformis.AAC.8
MGRRSLSFHILIYFRALFVQKSTTIRRRRSFSSIRAFVAQQIYDHACLEPNQLSRAHPFRVLSKINHLDCLEPNQTIPSKSPTPLTFSHPEIISFSNGFLQFAGVT